MLNWRYLFFGLTVAVAAVPTAKAQEGQGRPVDEVLCGYFQQLPADIYNRWVKEQTEAGTLTPPSLPSMGGRRPLTTPVVRYSFFQVNENRDNKLEVTRYDLPARGRTRAEATLRSSVLGLMAETDRYCLIGMKEKTSEGEWEFIFSRVQKDLARSAQ